MNAEFDKYFAPLKELNTIAVQNIEKLVDLQLKSLEENTKVSLEQLKNAAAINDIEGLKTYFNNQAEVTKQVAERAAEDARAVVELSNNYSNEFQRIVKENLPTAQSAA